MDEHDEKVISELRKRMLKFFTEMRQRMEHNFPEKDLTYFDISEFGLLQKLRKNIINEDWLDVANFAFMLHDRREKIKKSYKEVKLN